MSLARIATRAKYLVAVLILVVCCETIIGAATIAGVVRDAQGNPLGGVEVRMTCEHAPERAEEMASDKDGVYSFAKLPPGMYQLSAEKNGFAAVTPKAVTVSTELTSITTDFTLSRLEQDGEPAALQPRLKFEAAGIRGLIDPGGYSAPANAAAASGLISGVADIRHTENDAGFPLAADFPCSLESELTKAAAANPDSVDANRRLGEFYLAHGSMGQAILYLQRVRQIDPTASRTILYLSEALLRSGNFDAARDQLNAIPADARDVPFHRLSAKAEEQAGHFVTAFEEYLTAAEQDPSEANIFGEGYELILAGRPMDASGVFGVGVARYPLSTTLLIGAGTAEFLQGHNSTAVKLFLQATDSNPSDPRPYSFLTEAFKTSTVKDAQVLARLRRYSEQFPTRAEASYLYAVVLSQDNTSGAAADAQIESLLKQAIAFNPNLAKAHFQLGTLYAHREDYASAIREFEATEHLAPGMKEVHYRLASMYKRARHAEAAEREMELFREAHQSNVEDGGGGISIEQFISVVDRPHSETEDVRCFQGADK
jgi:tetratricopeptide (TPR) repeat protein